MTRKSNSTDNAKAQQLIATSFDASIVSKMEGSTLVLPLPVVGALVSQGSTDAVRAFVLHQIEHAMSAQYPHPVDVYITLSTDATYRLGSFGGPTAFRRLPHRSVAELTKRYSLDECYIRCAIHGDSAPVDICHGVPRSLGGNLTKANLTLGCGKCNKLQSNTLTPEAYYALLSYYLIVDVSAKAMKEYTR
jgi:hypothetical protein